MKRSIFINAVAVLASAVMVGCQSDSSAYQPAGSEAQVSATAAKTAYPNTMTSEMAPGLFYTVTENGSITLYNPGDTSVLSFTLWVNKSYSLIVDKLQPHTYRNVMPSTVYNQNGISLSSVPANTITSVQILSNGHLYDLPGPIHPG